MQIDPQKEKKLRRLAKVVSSGNIGILEYLDELESKIEAEIPSIKDIISRLKGEKGDSYVINEADKEEIINILKNKIDNKISSIKNGEDYVLTEQDKKDIAKISSSLIKIPIVEKVIEKTQVIKETPIITEKKIETFIENKDTGEQIITKINEDRTTLIKREKVEGLKQLEDRIIAVGERVIKGSGVGISQSNSNNTGGSQNLQQVTDIGATTTNPIGVPRVDFDTTYTPTGAEPVGSTYWNATDETLNLVQNGAIQQIGQELFIKVRNASGATIPNGTPVYFNGRQGNRPKIYPAKGDAEATSMVMGLTTQDIADNSDGLITTFGYVRQIKTDYLTWTVGEKLWVSKTTAGGLTNVEPAVPHHSDIVGEIAIVGGAGVGAIFVNIDRHKTLEELSNVNGTIPVEGSFPAYNATGGYFDFDKKITDYFYKAGISGGQTAIGGTGVTDILKLQGTSGNGTLTSPAIQFLVGNNGATIAGTILNNGNFGIGTTAPTVGMEISKLITDSNWDGLRISNNSAAYGSSETGVDFYHPSYSTARITSRQGAATDNPDLRFLVSDSSKVLQQRMIIDKNGNVGVGTTNPTQILQVGDTTLGSMLFNRNYLSGGASGSARLQINTGSSSGAYAGAYMDLVGKLETWVGVTANNNASGFRNMRFGNSTNGVIDIVNGTFAIQRLNDSFSAISATPFQMSNAAPDASLIINSSGNIGIGTATPSHLLTVAGTVRVNSDLRLYGAVTTTNYSELQSAVDANNAGIDALYIVPPVNNSRVYIGKSGKIAYSLNLQYVGSIESVPPLLTLSAGTLDGLNACRITTTATYLMLDAPVSNGYVSSRASATLSRNSIPFMFHAADTDTYKRAAGFIFAGKATAANWTSPHTIWTNNAETTTLMSLSSAGNLTVYGDLTLGTAGNKLKITEGTNATVGLATLVAGTVTVSTTAVTANSRIFLTRQTTAGTLGTSVDVTARTAGTSFTITSNGSILDTSTVAWFIIN